MAYFAGIDGGQTSTVAVVGDEGGRILGRGSAQGADEVGQDASSSRLHDALHDAVDDALANARLPLDTQFDCVVAGISGYEGRTYGRDPDLRTGALTLVHDTTIAHAGAFGGDPGVVVIAGTGSVAYAAGANGQTAIAGGWGYLFGDEGSAFWLVRRAFTGVTRETDIAAGTELANAMLDYFRVPSLRSLSRSFYTGGISRARFASFAPILLQLAESGNSQIRQYVDEGAYALAQIATQAAYRVGLASPKVALCGGMFLNDLLRDRTIAHVREALPGCEHVEARYEPAIGALLLAYEASGIHPERIVV